MVTARNDLATTLASGIASPIARTGAKLAGRLVLWLRARNTRHQLMRLSDDALEDIGTTRAAIPLFTKQCDPWQCLPGDAVFVLALGNLIERIEGWRESRRRQLQVRRELTAYSDRELNELGLSRGDIRRVARGASGASGRHSAAARALARPITRARFVDPGSHFGSAGSGPGRFASRRKRTLVSHVDASNDRKREHDARPAPGAHPVGGRSDRSRGPRPAVRLGGQRARRGHAEVVR